jgi:ATP-dependent helicase Lhr and Lhr-like helicase
MRVEDAGGAAPSVPFWRGEAPARTPELSAEVSSLRETATLDSLMAECGLDRSGAEQAVAYLRACSGALGVMPSQATVVAERFFDEAGGMQLVLHAPFGARLNRAWGLALRKRFCRTFNFELQAAATDNGIVISLTEQHSFPLELVFHFLKPETVKQVLEQALLASPMFTARWRWNASRALAVPRFSGGRKVPPPIQRMRSDDLLASVFPDQAACAENLAGEIRIPDHPLVRETIGNCLYEAMDLPGLRRLLEVMESGRIRTVAVDTAEPSPLSHEILNSNPFAYLDDAPLEERRARAVELRRTLPPEIASGPGALDPQAIAQVAAEAWPDVRDADELHDALLTLVLLEPVAGWREWFEELRGAGRAAGRRGLWVATEKAETAAAAEQGDEQATATVLRGWLESIVPATASELATRLSLPRTLIESALAHLEARGEILRGHFRPGASEIEWANRRLLARIHRLTLGRLRNEIEPVAPADLVRFLARWQHLAPGSQLHGVDGTLAIIRQLQGYEVPAAAWEAQVLRKRIARYDPEHLDRLCLAGEVMWGRLSPHPAFERAETGRRVRPTRVAPLSLFLREDAGWLLPALRDGDVPLSHAGRDVLAALERRGASFFAELVRESHRLPSEVEDGLWELVAGGLVTADGFENLRSLADPRRRRGEGSGRKARPRHAAGRWALLPRSRQAGAPDAERFAVQLLERWGIVFRDLIARETLTPPWRELLRVLRRMEDRGEVRGGRFVAGFLGEQFARPEAVEMVRKLRRADAEALDILAADPLNLAGIVLPGPRSSATAGPPLRLDARMAG